MKSFLTKLRQLLPNQSQKEPLINENLAAVNPAATFAMKYKIGLTISFYGGVYQDENGLAVEVEETTIAVPDNQSEIFIEFNPSTKLVTFNLIRFTTGLIRIAVVKSEAGEITEIFDRRAIAFYAEGTPPNLTYTLPQASSTVRGGVTIDPETLAFNEANQLTVIGGGGGGGGSLVVKENNNTINNNVTTLNFSNFQKIKSSGSTITLDNFCNFENILTYWIPVQSASSANSYGAWQGTTTQSNMGNWLINDEWSHSTRRSIVTTAVALNVATLDNTNGYIKRSIYKRGVFKAKFGYFTEFSASNVPASTVNNSSALVGFNTTNQTSFFTKDFETTSDSVCGVGWRSTDSNLQIVYTSAVTSTTTFIDLGENFPIPDLSKGITSVYEIIFDTNYSEVDISIYVKRLDVVYEISHTVPVAKVSYMRPRFSLITHDAVIKKMNLGSMFLYMN